MFNHLLEILENANNYVSAVQRGFDNFVQTLPILTKQHMEVQSKNKLGDRTQQNFMSAVSTKMINNILVVELDPDNWLANAVENGADPFQMKEGHLRSSKAKISKQGYRYMRIPIGVNKKSSPGTDKGKEFQKKIVEVLNKPKFGMKKLKMKLDGSVAVAQEVLTNDPDMGGLYRIQHYADAASFHGKKRPFKTDMILFRTMSDNPNSRSKWEHPGIKPAHIFRNTEQWLEQNIDQILNNIIDLELQKAGFK